MTSKISHVVQVAVPVPIRQHFDYTSEVLPAMGSRVLVSFGRRKLVGIVISSNPRTTHHRLKKITRILDPYPIITGTLLTLLHWSASYYHHPVGEVMSSALPVLLRQPQQIQPPEGKLHYRAIRPEPEGLLHLLARSPAQARIYQHLKSTNQWISIDQLHSIFRSCRTPLNALEKKSLVNSRLILPQPGKSALHPPVILNPEQQQAAEHICSRLEQFSTILLQGITGSGKTEVYLAAARQCIASGKQVLILVPEISLTPQLISRVKAQLGGNIYPLHSGMSNRERLNTWWMAKQGLADAVLGTRSAIFTWLKNPGLIVVDEEHDGSYKQQDGFRYHARDLAIKRGSLDNIPVILGSATPSLESLYNVQCGRHDLLKLNQRIGAARLPTITSVDLSIHTPENGISKPVISAIAACLQRGEQVIIYINRRGYAPVVHCYQCQWQALCPGCEARMTYHRSQGQFRCHHCGYLQPGTETCPACESPLFFGGAGTQRIEKAIQGKFPQARVCRLDRDEANTPRKLYRQLESIKNGEVDLIVGTQLITKGHDFANVSLVCVINADQGLFSIDFRAPEYMFQQLLQVSGRAGRAAANGEVLIQTQFPNDPYIRLIQEHDYPKFAEHCMTQRQQAEYPPWSRFALFRAEEGNQNSALNFLHFIRKAGSAIVRSKQFDQIEIASVVSAPMEKLAGRYRAQLLVRSLHRGQLHKLLDLWLVKIEESRRPSSIRWSLDVDPMDMY